MHFRADMSQKDPHLGGTPLDHRGPLAPHNVGVAHAGAEPAEHPGAGRHRYH
jgi:hypothetical protein